LYYCKNNALHEILCIKLNKPEFGDLRAFDPDIEPNVAATLQAHIDVCDAANV